MMEKNEISKKQISIGAGKILILSQEENTSNKLVQFCEAFNQETGEGGDFHGDENLLLKSEVDIVHTIITCNLSTPKENLGKALESRESEFLKALNSFPHGRDLVKKAVDMKVQIEQRTKTQSKLSEHATALRFIEDENYDEKWKSFKEYLGTGAVNAGQLSAALSLEFVTHITKKLIIAFAQHILRVDDQRGLFS